MCCIGSARTALPRCRPRPGHRGNQRPCPPCRAFCHLCFPLASSDHRNTLVQMNKQSGEAQPERPYFVAFDEQRVDDGVHALQSTREVCGTRLSQLSPVISALQSWVSHTLFSRYFTPLVPGTTRVIPVLSTVQCRLPQRHPYLQVGSRIRSIQS